MKKMVSIVLSCLFSLSVLAQEEDVTRFLGIPVDGTKSEMIRKLREKGYRYDASSGMLEGEFNGTDVLIGVVTNNNKVYRIMVVDAHPTDVRNIQIRFNRLCVQFGNNSRYTPVQEDQTIPDDEDIAYEIAAHDKRYEATFFQNPIDLLIFSTKKLVWFMIDEQYGMYRILMFYDNQYNQASGEDL